VAKSKKVITKEVERRARQRKPLKATTKDPAITLIKKRGHQVARVAMSGDNQQQLPTRSKTKQGKPEALSAHHQIMIDDGMPRALVRTR